MHDSYWVDFVRKALWDDRSLVELIFEQKYYTGLMEFQNIIYRLARETPDMSVSMAFCSDEGDWLRLAAGTKAAECGELIFARREGVFILEVPGCVALFSISAGKPRPPALFPAGEKLPMGIYPRPGRVEEEFFSHIRIFRREN